MIPKPPTRPLVSLPMNDASVLLNAIMPLLAESNARTKAILNDTTISTDQRANAYAQHGDLALAVTHLMAATTEADRAHREAVADYLTEKEEARRSA